MAEGKAGFNASLAMRHVSPSRHIDKIHNPPSEVQAWLKSIGEDAETFLDRVFNTNLRAQHFRPDPSGTHIGHHADRGAAPDAPHVIVNDPDLHGVPHVLIEERTLGSGLVTNAGASFLANALAGITGFTPSLFNQHLLGTGSTAAALSDVYAQTPILAASLTGSTNGYMAGTQSYVISTTAVPHPIYQTVATFTCLAATLAVTEWALAAAAVLPVNRTSAGAAPTNNTFTDTGATFVTAGNGLAGYTVEAVAASPINTPTSTNRGTVLSNTATVLTLVGPSASTAWLTLLDATGANPAATITYSVFPTIADHKVFSALNLVTSDTLAITYQLQVTSGG